MKKLIISIILSFVLAGSFALAPASYADYRNFPPHNSQFHPQHPDYYDGNQRLKLKKRADIERASASNLHYDQYSRDYYRCNWKYNTNLGTWVCEKDYGSPICPFGYTKHPIQNNCVPIRLAANSRLNARGDGWVCNSGYHMNYAGTGCERNQVQYTYYPDEPEQIVTTKYVYVYGNEEPISLPSTGTEVGLMMLISAFGGYLFLRRKTT